MATSRLKIYNGALEVCGERALASLTVNEESRYILDTIWNDDGVRYCLEQAQWKFAMRSARFDYDPSVSPDWGYARAFPKPTDWVATSAVCTDEYFNSPLTQYADEAGYWFADMEELYVKYVSDDDLYGMDFSKWPSSFTEYVKHYFARRAAPRLPGDKDADRIMKKESLALGIAKNKDAMAGPTTFPARGSWLASRFGRGGVNRRDGGSRTGNLIG